METLELIQRLYHAEPAIRRQAALVIGMVQETTARVALEQRLGEEPDSNILRVVLWADKRVQEAEKNNFTTIDAIFEHFQINRELASGITPDEANLLRHSSFGQSPGAVLVADQSKIAMLRMLPVPPTDTPIKHKIKQLMNSDDPRRQKNAAMALREINNPEALPYLALVFFRNKNSENQEIIERSGKLLYWSINYAAMDRSGHLKFEIMNRLRNGMYAEQSLKPQPVKQPSVTDILDQAQKRRKRKKRD